MALLKCPDCGKAVSSHAKACPDCGCPIEYMTEEASNASINESAPISTNMSNPISNTQNGGVSGDNPGKILNKTELLQRNMIDFSIASGKITYPSDNENNKTFAGIFGNYIRLGQMARKELRRVYKKCSNIEEALREVPEVANDTLAKIIEQAVGILFSVGINCTEEDFIEKYYYQHNIDYSQYYSQIVEAYSLILDLADEMKQYREMEKASRSRWVGGGFGVKGAIKGAVTASIMNAGTDFIRSFGDSAKERSDNAKIQAGLKNLYEEESTQVLMCDTIYTCIMNVYLSMKEEMIRIGKLDEELFVLDLDEADILFENTNRFVGNRNLYISKVIDCIKLYPGRIEYYQAIENEIFDEVWKHLDDDNYNGFYEFLDFWGIGFFYPKDEVSGQEVSLEDEKKQKAIKEGKQYKTVLDKTMANKGYRLEDFKDISTKNVIDIFIDLYEYDKNLDHMISVGGGNTIGILTEESKAEIAPAIDDFFDELDELDDIDPLIFSAIPTSIGMGEFLTALNGPFIGKFFYLFPKYNIHEFHEDQFGNVDPNKKLSNLLSEGETVELFWDCSVFENLKKGFAITTRQIIDLSTRTSFNLSDINKISVVDDYSILIADDTKQFTFVLAEKEPGFYPNEFECKKMVALIIALASGFCNNNRLGITFPKYKDVLKEHKHNQKLRKERELPEEEFLVGPDLFIKNLCTEIKDTPAENIISVEKIDALDKDYVYKISRALKKKNIGNRLLFCDSKYNPSIILTDVFFSAQGFTIPLTEIKDIFFYVSEDLSKGAICISTEDDEFKTNSTLERKKYDVLSNAINAALGNKDGKDGLRDNVLERKFETIYAESPVAAVPLDSNVENYVKIRRFVHEFCSENEIHGIPMGSEAARRIYTYLKDGMGKQPELLKYAHINEWVPESYSKEKFFLSIAEDREYLNDTYLNNTWIYGDSFRSDYAPTEDQRKLFEDSNLYMYKDFTQLHSAKKGFALTGDYIMDLHDKSKLFLKDIKEIVYYTDDKCVGITDKNDKTLIIKNKDLWDDDDKRWDDECKLRHIMSIIRVFCVRYCGNETVLKPGMHSKVGEVINTEERTEVKTSPSVGDDRLKTKSAAHAAAFVFYQRI